MRQRIVRVLSTGRCGTKWLSEFFCHIGVESYHEGFYSVQPQEALIGYMNDLANRWVLNRDAFYADRSRSADAYVRKVQQRFRWQRVTRLGARGLIVDTDNMLTPWTALLEPALQEAGIETRNLILFRNPYKTIHAMRTVEGAGAFPHRPDRFHHSKDAVMMAAEVWARIYEMALEFKERYPTFHLLKVEDFSSDFEKARQTLDFVGVTITKSRYEQFRTRLDVEKYRTSKVQSVRNSDLFHEPRFVISEAQMAEMDGTIQPIAEELGIDLAAAKTDYLQFHRDEKPRIFA
jgi:hypothetical protein